jgi:hypothetical protein
MPLLFTENSVGAQRLAALSVLYICELLEEIFIIDLLQFPICVLLRHWSDDRDNI